MTRLFNDNRIESSTGVPGRGLRSDFSKSYIVGPTDPFSSIMRLTTHNMLKCNVKGIVTGYPLRIEVEKIEVLPSDYDAG